MIGFSPCRACLGMALMVLASSAAWADALVLEDMVGDPSYHRGQRLPSGSTAIIPQGSVLYVIEDDQKLHRWEGAQHRSLSIGEEKPHWLDHLVNLLFPKGYSETTSIQRDANGSLSAPTADLIDPFLDGNSGNEISLCYDPARSVRLWYGGQSDGFTFTLARSGHKAEVKGTWPNGPTSIAWPTSVPLNTDTTYRLNATDQPPERSFRLIATPAVSHPALPQAEELARLGCRDQAFVMLRWLADHPTP